MMAVGGGFELSEWFNSVSARGSSNGGSGRSAAASAPNKRASAGKEHAPESSVCFMCHTPNPQWTSSDKVKKAPPVPVCSPDCETRYLESKGLRPVRKDGSKKRKQDDIVELLDDDDDDDEKMGGDDDVDYEHCFVCERPGPEYMSTTSVKSIPSVPVCGIECEAEHLKRKGKKKKAASATTTVTTNAAKRSKPASESSKSTDVKQSLSFLEDHLLENDDSKGYKSWWLRALTFYDFVYQRHAMWHRCGSGSVAFQLLGCSCGGVVQLHVHAGQAERGPGADELRCVVVVVSIVEMGGCEDADSQELALLLPTATWNIYRELDRTTAYFRKSVVRWQKAHQDHRSLREVLWMAVVFRFCNKIETFYDVQGIPKSDEFKAFKKRCVLPSLAESRERERACRHALCR